MADSDVKLLNGQVKVEAPEGVKIQGNTEIDGNLTIKGEVDGKLSVNLLEAGNSGLGKSILITAEGFIGIVSKNLLSLSGKQVIFGTQDIILNNSKIQESPEPTGSKNIALSHSDGDKLVLNKGEGYKGGVEIEGKFLIRDNSQDGNDYKYITIECGSVISHHCYKKYIPGPTPNSGRYIKETTNFDLVEELMKMKNEIKELKEKVKTLGG